MGAGARGFRNIQARVQVLDEATDIFALFDEAERGPESKLADHVVCHVSGISGLDSADGIFAAYAAHQEKSNTSQVLMNLSSSFRSQALILASAKGSIFLALVKLYYTKGNSCLNIRAHTYWTRNMFPECSMCFMRSHIDHALYLPKASRNVESCLVYIAMVDLGKLLGVTDHQHRWSDLYDRSWR